MSENNTESIYVLAQSVKLNPCSLGFGTVEDVLFGINILNLGKFAEQNFLDSVILSRIGLHFFVNLFRRSIIIMLKIILILLTDVTQISKGIKIFGHIEPIF